MSEPANNEAQQLALLQRQIELMRDYALLANGRAPAMWLLNEAIFRLWEAPRLQHPRLGKYSLHLPWSPRAYERLAQWKPGESPRPSTDGLRFEHLVPRKYPTAALLENDPPDLRAFLKAHFRAAVITIEEDHQLNAVGAHHSMPAGWSLGDDVWARYEAAGLSRAEFRVPVHQLGPDPTTVAALDAMTASTDDA